MNRYQRNIQVIGAEGQERLSAASILVIGCGALGGQVSMLLAGAGVGHIALADFDNICVSNLQRQLFFSEREAGRPKVSVLASRIAALNSEVTTEVVPSMITEKNAHDLIEKVDFVIEATDNRPSKSLIERICREHNTPCCIGGVAGWRGQVVTVVNGSTGMDTLFPDNRSDAEVLPCEAEGVMGPVASLIASVQAAEALKFLSGNGALLIDRCFCCDLSASIFATIPLT